MSRTGIHDYFNWRVINYITTTIYYEFYSFFFFSFKGRNRPSLEDRYSIDEAFL